MKKRILIFILTTLVLASPSLALDRLPAYDAVDGFVPVIGSTGMVSSRHKMATKVGADILKSGGNAIDAAVTAAFVQMVVTPRSCGIGGFGPGDRTLRDGGVSSAQGPRA